MINKLTSAFLVAVLSLGGLSTQTLPLSPCPNVFKYELPGSEPGRWYGVVTLSTDITLHGLWLNIVLDSKADILGNWIGEVTTTDNMDFKVENTTFKIHPGPAQTVRFFIQYNQLGKAPRLTAIRLNGREICNINNPLPAADRPTYNTQDEVYTLRPVETRPVESRPVRPIDTRPVYTPPPSENLPFGQTNMVQPYSIAGGGVNVQDVGIQTDKGRPSSGSGSQSRPSSIDSSRPSYDQTRPGTQNRPTGSQNRPNSRPDVTYPDYSDDNGAPGTDNDYFSGGLPTINKMPSRAPSRPNVIDNGDRCGKVIRNATPLIVNGRPTLEGQWPWQIALYQTQTVDSKYICGGTLVSRNYVITAAHCVTRKGSARVVNKNTLTIYLGKHNLRTSIEGVQIKFVGQIMVHPEYNATSYSRDVGVLKLRDPADITEYVRAACLWPDDQTDLSYVIGKRGTVVGWGFDDKGLATEELTLVEMPIVEQETCIRSYSEFFARFTSEFTFCAGYRDGTSVCNGDSGGGMVFKMDDTWFLRGLVSLSVARQNEYRCDPTHYVVFTDLAKYLGWLKQAMAGDF